MSEVTVRIPGPLRPFTGGEHELRVAPGTVAEVIGRIGERHPQVPPRLLTPDGHLRPYVNIFVGPANVRGLQGLGTFVGDGAIVSIIPAVAGG